MITQDQLIDIIVRYSGEAITAETVRSQMPSESGQFLRAVAEQVWLLGFEAGQPKPLTTKQKCDLFNTARTRMQAIEETQRLMCQT